MKKLISKTLLSILNIIFIGSGFALTQRLKKALLLQLSCYAVFAISGYFGILSDFYGFIFCFGAIFLIYVYATLSFILTTYSDYQNWKKNILFYCIAVFALKLICVLPVRSFFFEPKKYNGDYFMLDKRDAANIKPLYIFWSDDLSLIGKNLSKSQ